MSDVANIQMMRPNEVAARLGVARRTLYDWLREPNSKNPFPKPVKLGRATAWHASDISAWLERQA